MDLQQVAKSFGFTQPPAVDLSEYNKELLGDERDLNFISSLELAHKFKKPERRPGNRGYGKLMTMNKEDTGEKKVQFKHIPDRKQLKKVANKIV